MSLLQAHVFLQHSTQSISHRYNVLDPPAVVRISSKDGVILITQSVTFALFVLQRNRGGCDYDL